MQASRFECFPFDPFSLLQNAFVPAEVDIGGCDVVEALVEVLPDEFEPVSEWTVSLSLMTRRDRATRQEQRHG